MSSTQTTGRYPGDILIGDLMVKAGVISQTQLEEAVKLAGNKHLQLGQMLIMAGHISPRDLQAAVDAQSMLRDRQIDQNTATRCLKIACKTGMNFVDVCRDQEGAKTTTNTSTNKLGELLLEANLIDREQFGKSMQRSLATGLPLGRILVLNGALSETLLNTALEIQVRLRDEMLNRDEAVEALRGQIGDLDPEEAQRQTLTLQTVLANPPRKKGIRLGELMVLAGLLNETDVMSALELGLVNDTPIGEVMVQQGYMTHEMLDNALALQKRVDAGDLQATEAGQVLAKISANGNTLDEAIAEFVSPPEPVYETLSFDRMLTLSRVITDEQIDESFNRAIASPQILAKLLVLTDHISNAAMQAVLQCYSMMSNNFLSQDDAIIALDYCLNEAVDRNITFGEALQELGWSATQSIQMQAQNSVAVTHIKLQAMMNPDGSLMAPENEEGARLTATEGEEGGYTEAMAAQEAANEGDTWLPEEGALASSAEAVSDSLHDDSENFNVTSGNLGVEPEPVSDQMLESEPEQLPFDESAEMREAEEIADPQENFEEIEVAHVDDDNDFSEVFEAQAVDEDTEEKVEEDKRADSIEAEFSNDKEIASSASVPSEEHEAIVPGPDDDAENEAFRKEFSLDASDVIKDTELGAPAAQPSLADLMSQAKVLEDKMAAESDHTMDEAKSKFEKEVQKGSGSLKDLFKPESTNEDSKTDGNGHTPAVQPGTPAAPSPIAAVASTSNSTEAEATQAPKGLGDLFKANISPAASSEATVASDTKPNAMQALLQSENAAAKPAASNSLQAMLAMGGSSSTSSSASSSPAAATPQAPPASGGLSGLLAGFGPTANPSPTTSSSALQALTPLPATAQSVPAAEAKKSAEKEPEKEVVAAEEVEQPKPEVESVAPEVEEAPATEPVVAAVEPEATAEPEPIAETSAAAPTPEPPVVAAPPVAPVQVQTPASSPLPPVKPLQMPPSLPAAQAPAAQAPAPVAAAAPASAPIAAPAAPPAVAAPTAAAPVAPQPLTPAVQPAQQQPVPTAEVAHQAFDESANRLAESYYEQGNFAEAQKLYERILAAKEQQLGPNHQSLGADLTNLAGVMCVQGLFQQAEPYVRRVVSLIEQGDPLDLLKLADCLKTLAGIQFQLGKFVDAEPLLGRALKLRQQKLGSEHQDIADDLRDYAKLLRKLQREEEAEFMYAQAKAILAKRAAAPKDEEKVSAAINR